MSNILVKENIVLGLDSVSREESIVLAGKKLVERGYVNEGYVDAMLEREKTMSTNMGLGFAIPHGVNEAKKEIKDLREGRKIIRNSFEIKEYKPVMEGVL